MEDHIIAKLELQSIYVCHLKKIIKKIRRGKLCESVLLGTCSGYFGYIVYTVV
jgi:hypothetical protein